MTNIDVPRWRPAMEGAQILAQKMEKRVLRISLEQMRTGGVSSVTQLARPQLWHAMAQLGPYLAMAGSKRLDLGTSSSLDSKKPGRDCPKIPKSFEETTRGGFLEVLCGFVKVSSSVSTQFSTFFFAISRKLLMKRLLPMQSLLTLGTGNELKGLESCEEKLGGAVVGTMDGTFWVPCIITGWAHGGGTMVKHGVKPCVDAFPDGFFWVVHGGHFPTEESIEMGDPKRRIFGDQLS